MEGLCKHRKPAYTCLQRCLFTSGWASWIFVLNIFVGKVRSWHGFGRLWVCYLFVLFILHSEKRKTVSFVTQPSSRLGNHQRQHAKGKKGGGKLIQGQRKPDKMGGRYRRGTSCLTFLIPVLIWYLRSRKVYFTMRQTNKHASVDRPNKSQLWNSISVTAAQIISLTS